MPTPETLETPSASGTFTSKWWQFWLWKLSTGDGVAFAGIFISLFVGGGLAVGQWFASNQTSKRQEAQTTMQIAVGVLSKKAPRTEDGGWSQFPRDEQILREWAVDEINRVRGPISKPIVGEARDVLVKGGASLWNYGSGWGSAVDYVITSEDDLPLHSEDGRKLRTESPHESVPKKVPHTR